MSETAVKVSKYRVFSPDIAFAPRMMFTGIIGLDKLKISNDNNLFLQCAFTKVLNADYNNITYENTIYKDVGKYFRLELLINFSNV